MLNDRYGRSVPAAELVRNFAHWREVGVQEPLLVTHHGRGTHIFMGLDHFRTMTVNGPETAAGPDLLAHLAAWIHQGLILCRADYTIGHVNHAALAMARRWDRHLAGLSLWDALPELAESLTQSHIRRSMEAGEGSAADIPSPFRENCWIRFETFPFPDGVALLLSDITEDVRRNRLADAKASVMQAMRVHGGVGHVQVSNRGFIEFADDIFCAMVGLPLDRLVHISLTDLADLPARPRLREELEHVLRGEGDRRIATSLLANSGAVLPAEIGIAPLQGLYGSEGAILVVTRQAEPVNSAN
ncbi:PAS fold-containing protein [Sphingobium faniae]|nr:PAS fold-containing protein [Sphingobium faniae]